MNVENREVNPKLIDNINALKTAINEISVYDLNTYTAIELYYRIANKLNEVISELLRYEIAVSEQVVEQNNCLQYLLNEGLTNEVVNKINKMVSDGTMASIINNNVFTDINNRMDNLEAKTNTDINNLQSEKRDKNVKITKNDIDITSDNTKIGLLQLSQEVHNALSGNASVSPTITDGSVTTEKIANNSISMNKLKCSQGNFQDVIYCSTVHYLKRVDNAIYIKFIGSPSLYYKNIELKIAQGLTTTEFNIPHNYSLVFSYSNKNLVVKNTDECLTTDLILLSCHNGIAKVNNLKSYNPLNYPIIHTDAEARWKKDNTDNIIITFSGDKRVFIKSNTFGNIGYNFAITLNDSYTLSSNEALCASLYDATIVIKNWDNLGIDDIVLCCNRKGVLAENNINLKEINAISKLNDSVYYRGRIWAEKNSEETFIIRFEKIDNPNLFYRFKDSVGLITLDTFVYTVGRNQGLLLDLETKKLIVGDIENLAKKQLILLTVYNHRIINCKLTLENSIIPQGFNECQDKNVLINGDFPTGQGMTLIGDELLVFQEAKDDHTEYSSLNIVDINTLKIKRTIQHNIGHVNSVDYNPNNDCLIIGNNTGSGQEIPPAIYIIYNATSLINQSQINFNTISKSIINLYEGETFLGNYGNLSRPNVCWGENDRIAYLIINDNGVCYKLQLGKGINNLNTTKTDYTWGEFLNVDDDKYNGTCKIMKTYYNSTNLGVNQGISLYKGKIYVSCSHNDVLTAIYSLKSNGVMQLEDTITNNLFNENGEKIEVEPEDIVISDGKLYQTFRGSVNGVVINEL